MGGMNAQKFWDRTWLWEKYERFPTETVDDPHLVVQLSSQVEAAGGNGDAALFARYDECVGRVLQRLTDAFSRFVDGLEAELKHWLKFGLRHDVRGHDEALWQKSSDIAKQVDDEHHNFPQSSRYEAGASSLIQRVTAK